MTRVTLHHTKGKNARNCCIICLYVDRWGGSGPFENQPLANNKNGTVFSVFQEIILEHKLGGLILSFA